MGRTKRPAIDQNGFGFNITTGIEWYARAIFSDDGGSSSPIDPAFQTPDDNLDYTTVHLPFSVGPEGGSAITVWGVGTVSYGPVTLAQRHFMMALSSLSAASDFPGYFDASGFGRVASTYQIDIGYRDFEGTATLNDPFSTFTSTTVTFSSSDAEPVVYINWDGTVALIRGGSAQFGGIVREVSSNTTVRYPGDLAPVAAVTGTSARDTLRANSQTASDYNGAVILKLASEHLDSAAPRNLDNAFDFRADANILDAELVPHATIRAEWSGQADYYSFTVAPEGGHAVFDIDASYLFDSVLSLYQVDFFGNYTLLATNDDDPALDPGSTTSLDSSISYDFTEGGTYVIVVDRFGGTTPTSESSYVLNVSLERAQLAHPTIANGVASFGIDGGVVNAFEGNDVIFGSAGDDVINGGAGTDLLTFEDATRGVFVDMRWGEAHGEGDDRFVNVENVTGSAFADVLRGNGIANTLRGGAGADTLLGRIGDDALFGDEGNDFLDGGPGNDAMRGGPGDDTYIVDAAGDTVTELASGGSDRVRTSVSYSLDRSAEVEFLETINATLAIALDLQGSDTSNTITGNAGQNILYGHGGNDVLQGREGNDFLVGGAGADAMYGGLGDDVFYVDDAGDAVFELAGEGNDRISSSISFTLGGTISIETIETANASATTTIDLGGSDVANTIMGNAGNNILRGFGGNDVLWGFAGTDFLVGGTGADVMWGGTGDDTYYVDNVGDRIYELAGEGYDRVAAEISVTLPDNAEIELLEAVNLTATVAMDLGGSDFANTIRGNAGINILYGYGGNDTLYGYGGNDFLVGGTGADAMYGGTGNDTYYVDSSDDYVYEAVGEGTDRIATTISLELSGVSEVEILEVVNSSGTEALVLTGSDFANTIIGNAGNNVINGRGGSDSLVGLGGADVFQFTTALGPNNIDRIEDFQAGVDKIALDDAIFTTLAAGQLSAGAFVIGPAAVDASDRIIYDSATGALYYDADGNGAGAAVQFAALAAGLALSATDFVII